MASIQNEYNSLESLNAINSTLTSIGSRYKSLFLSQKYTDCTFKVGQTFIKCHKLILTAASPVFEAMFYGPMREEHPIEILDITTDCFYYVMNYIYAGETNNLDKLSLNKTIEIYYSAEKYLLYELSIYCLNSIKQKLNFQNILPALDFAANTNLNLLTQICMEFLNRFCLNNFEFIKYIETKYYHVTKDCIKAIIETIPKAKHLIWFIVKWAENESECLGLTKDECDNLITDELKIDKSLTEKKRTENVKETTSNCFKIIERKSYKAHSPFFINFHSHNPVKFNFIINTNRFISLYGIILYSRLIPRQFCLDRFEMTRNGFKTPYYYEESLIIEISVGLSEDVIYRHQIDKQKTVYNSDLNIMWGDGVTMQPHLDYNFRIIWPSSEFGAEYPRCLQSNEVNGITFQDSDLFMGSIVKGIRLIDSV